MGTTFLENSGRILGIFREILGNFGKNLENSGKLGKNLGSWETWKKILGNSRSGTESLFSLVLLVSNFPLAVNYCRNFGFILGLKMFKVVE